MTNISLNSKYCDESSSSLSNMVKSNVACVPFKSNDNINHPISDYTIYNRGYLPSNYNYSNVNTNTNTNTASSYNALYPSVQYNYNVPFTNAYYSNNQDYVCSIDTMNSNDLFTTSTPNYQFNSLIPSATADTNFSANPNYFSSVTPDSSANTSYSSEASISASINDAFEKTTQPFLLCQDSDKYINTSQPSIDESKHVYEDRFCLFNENLQC